MSTGSDAKGGSPAGPTAARPPGPQDVDPHRGNGRPRWRLVLLVVGMGAVVTVATKGIQLILPGASLSDGWVLAVRVAGGALVAAGLARLMVERARLLAGPRPSRDPTVVGLRTAATIMGAVALLGLLNPPPASPTDGGEGRSLGLPEVAPWGSDGPPGEVVEARSRGGESIIVGRGGLPFDPVPLPSIVAPAGGLAQRVVALLPQIFVLALVLSAILLLLRRSRRRGQGLDDDMLLVPSDAEESLEASLAEVVGYGGDPRGQITRAYHSLLSALALAGAPREPQEAPHEHLRRALAPLGVRPGALHRLTGLYVLAQFGARPVTERHRVAAVDALEASLADLRTSVRSTPERAALASTGRA